jgi:4-amino-4-deoxy-L-arabinose transferase-like glycosyltransferase
VWSDRFVNLVQWICFVGCLIGVSIIARLLGADRRGEILAAVSCASIPLAVMAASGPKNDLVMTFWLVVAMYSLLRWKDEQDWIKTLAIGAAIALALFTKGTAYTYLPCLVACCWFMWPATARRRFLMTPQYCSCWFSA